MATTKKTMMIMTATNTIGWRASGYSQLPVQSSKLQFCCQVVRIHPHSATIAILHVEEALDLAATWTVYSTSSGQQFILWELWFMRAKGLQVRRSRASLLCINVSFQLFHWFLKRLQLDTARFVCLEWNHYYGASHCQVVLIFHGFEWLSMVLYGCTITWFPRVF